MLNDLLSRRPIDSLAEREIDLLLLMALHCSPRFRAAFVEKAMGGDDFRFLGAWRGVYDFTGESDLIVLIENPDGHRVAIMVEDKIDARFQPDQAERCRQRGENGRGQWDQFVTCLCAPKAYAEPVGKTNAWDAIVTYEDLAAVLAGAGESFSAFIVAALDQAVTKQRQGGFVPSPEATEFWGQYRSLQRAEFPLLSMTRLGEVQGVNEPWPRFGEGSLPPRVKLEHKPRKGQVGLTFQDLKLEDVRRRLDGLLPAGFEFRRTPPSAAVTVNVPPLDALKPFEPQVEAIRTALRAAESFLDQWPRIRAAAGFPAATADPRPAVAEGIA